MVAFHTCAVFAVCNKKKTLSSTNHAKSPSNRNKTNMTTVFPSVGRSIENVRTVGIDDFRNRFELLFDNCKVFETKLRIILRRPCVGAPMEFTYVKHFFFYLLFLLFFFVVVVVLVVFFFTFETTSTTMICLTTRLLSPEFVVPQSRACTTIARVCRLSSAIVAAKSPAIDNAPCCPTTTHR
jgi:hypothetical protein